MTHRIGLWIAAVALALRAVVGPLTPAIAPVEAALGEVCSAEARLGLRLDAEPATPSSPDRRHLLSHCADCLGGGVLSLPATPLALPVHVAGPCGRLAAPGATPLPAFAALLPPPRGPPSIVRPA